MLRHLKFGWLLVLMTLFVVLLVVPVSAQESAPGLEVVTSQAGVAIYRINPDGSKTRVVFVAAVSGATVGDVTADTTAGQGGGSTSSDASVSSDIFQAGYLIINAPALNVRSGPGAQYTVVAAVAGGDFVDVIGRNDGRENWWFVELANGQRGWVNNIFVLVRGDLRGAPVVEDQGVLIEPTLYIGFPGNPIFASLPHQGIPACYLPGRVEFPIIGRSSKANWFQINATCLDGAAVTGWIQAELGIVRNPAHTPFPVTDGN
jgi:hypothetical protein